MAAKLPGDNDKVVNFKKNNKTQNTHEVLSQNPYYKFIHSLLHAVESAGLPLDKSADEKAREIFAKYQRENQFAVWEKELAEEKAQKEKEQQNSLRAHLVSDNNANAPENTNPENNKPKKTK